MAIFLFLSMLLGMIFEKKIDDMQTISIQNMIDLANLKGDEKILDLGTGAGVVAINFAKNLKNGKVYGLDRWNWLPLINSKLVLTMMVGSNIENTKKNALLENVSDKCVFVSGSFTEKLEFPNNYFDIICSSQSLYFIRNSEHRKFLFDEINRILKKEGKFIFFEPKENYSGWDINNVKTFFEKLGYHVDLSDISTPKRWKKQYILHGIKI